MSVDFAATLFYGMELTDEEFKKLDSVWEDEILDVEYLFMTDPMNSHECIFGYVIASDNGYHGVQHLGNAAIMVPQAIAYKLKLVYEKKFEPILKRPYEPEMLLAMIVS